MGADRQFRVMKLSAGEVPDTCGDVSVQVLAGVDDEMIHRPGFGLGSATLYVVPRWFGVVGQAAVSAFNTATVRILVASLQMTCTTRSWVAADEAARRQVPRATSR